VETTHEFNVEGFEGMACRLNEVDARMDAIVYDVCPVRFILCLEVCIEARFNTLQDRLPAVVSIFLENLTCLHC
jgi:hypothetical protein